MTSFTNKTKRLLDMIASYNLDEKMPSEMRFNQFVIRLSVNIRTLFADIQVQSRIVQMYSPEIDHNLQKNTV